MNSEPTDTRLTAEEMDEIRQKNIAYEYLCHLEETKVWLESILREPLPSSTELEENLRNGVFLAKLGNHVSPTVIPANKIYDSDQKRYRESGLQFRHTDNINYWLKSLQAVELPVTFHPETTDVYDKKNMPRVIYCLHALNTHLYKLGKTPLIQDLYGKVNFTDADITAMCVELNKSGVQMPAFQKIGGMLSKNVGDQCTLNEAIVAINDAISLQDEEALLKALKNPAAHLHSVRDDNINLYLQFFEKQKLLKEEAVFRKSLNDSFVEDEHQLLLTQAEILGHIHRVNVASLLLHITKAAENNVITDLIKYLHSDILNLKDVFKENGKYYIKELLNIRNISEFFWTDECCNILQEVVMIGNKHATKEKDKKKYCQLDNQSKVSSAICKVYNAITKNDSEQLFQALSDPVLKFSNIIEKFACPLYLLELKIAQDENQESMKYEDLRSFLQVLTNIAKLTLLIDDGKVNEVWSIICNDKNLENDLDFSRKSDYCDQLTACYQFKLASKCDCPILTYSDIMECIDIVNSANEDNQTKVEAIGLVNFAVRTSNEIALVSALKSPCFSFRDEIYDEDGPLFSKLLEDCLRKKEDGTELWLQDIEAVVSEVNFRRKAAQEACILLAQINSNIQKGDVKNSLKLLKTAGFGKNEDEKPLKDSYFTALRNVLKLKAQRLQKSPWIKHKIFDEDVYLNLVFQQYSWKEPKNYFHSSQLITFEDIKAVFHKIQQNSLFETKIILLQAHIRGMLTRRHVSQMKDEYTKSAIKIQNWWRILLQRKYSTLCHELETRSVGDLANYKYQVQDIIKIQALWRGYWTRRNLTALCNLPEPPFSAVRYFVHLLDFNANDYQKQFQLQNLKERVVRTIRHNQQLSHQLDSMDIKIGLLIQNRVSLQDVINHRKKIHHISRKNYSENKGLKSLTKANRKLLDGYQHLFYLLQTNPEYLAKLIFCLPPSRTNKFLHTVVLSLFNFGANAREEYLLLKLFKTALQEEVRLKIEKPQDVVTGHPLVLQMALSYARQASGTNSLRELLGPLIQKILNDKTIYIETQPEDIYKRWRNENEMETGKPSNLPYNVSDEEALKHSIVCERLAKAIESLKLWSTIFLDTIIHSRNKLPYGLLYIGKVLRNALLEKFPDMLEKECLKIVGNLIYYHYLNTAIVAPDTFDIVTVSPNNHLTYFQRRNLASIAKILQFSATKKGFGDEHKHLLCLNPFIVKCHEKFKTFFKYCCEVEELEEHFHVHQYSEAALITQPVIYITLQEICDTHELLVQNLDHIAPDSVDPLSELLEEIGPPKTIEALLGSGTDSLPVSNLRTIEICLTLVNKSTVPENSDILDLHKLFIRMKDLLVLVLPCLNGSDLKSALSSSETEVQEELYSERLQQRQAHQKLYKVSYANAPSPNLKVCKQQIRQYLAKLELGGLVSMDDSYQNVLTAIARDIYHRGKYRDALNQELSSMKAAVDSLDAKTKFYEEQIASYDQYIQKCLENLNAGKRNIHTLKGLHKEKSKKLLLKYTAAKLRDKGVLLEVEGLPESQLKNVLFEISPSDLNGVFIINSKFMGVEMEKLQINIQELLQLQFEGSTIMNMFGKAKVNVNLLLFLLNRKFYGKT